MKSSMKAIKQSFSKFGKFLDPFLVVSILGLFLIPILTVINLTPASQPPYSAKRVLGEQDRSKVEITPVTDASGYISVDHMNIQTENVHTLYIQTSPHQKGIYQAEIFTADNLTHEEKKIQLSSNFDAVPEGTTVAVIVDDVRFIVLDKDGTTYPPSLYVMPGDSMSVGLEVQSTENVNFDAGFALDVIVE